MKKLGTGISTFALMVVLSPAMGPAWAQTLHSNPFARPSAAAGIDTIMGDPASGGFKLRGVLVAGEDSMANIGGVIVPVGGEIDGYRLISVSEREAVLERDGVRTLLIIEKQ